MELNNTDELLCIKGRSKNYAFEFSYIAEICPGVQVSKVPCLPESFIGVCSHKGEIVPLIRMEDMEGEGDGTELTFIIHWELCVRVRLLFYRHKREVRFRHRKKCCRGSYGQKRR